MDKVEIYTDGSCLNNPGRGGVGIVLSYKGNFKEISEGYNLSTNNRMELQAVITALQNLKKDNLDIIIYSDSKYVVDAVDKGWLFNWIKKDFKGKKNKDLWLIFYELYKKHTIKFVWVKGHSDNKLNNICDKLAIKAANSNNLKIDEGYEYN